MLSVGDMAVYSNTGETLFVHDGDIVEILSMNAKHDAMIHAFPLKWGREGVPGYFASAKINGKPYIPLKRSCLSVHKPACMFKGGDNG